MKAYLITILGFQALCLFIAASSCKESTSGIKAAHILLCLANLAGVAWLCLG